MKPNAGKAKLAAATAVAATLAVAAAGASEAGVLGRDTTSVGIQAGPPLDPAKPSFRTLVEGASSGRLVRPLPGTRPLPGRSRRRSSQAYFAALTDFQLADEESPARVEFLDKFVSSSAWRPQEALHPFEIDQSLRQVDAFAKGSPTRQYDGRRARMRLALLTGDLADSQQRNEATWVRQLLEGKVVNPNSGVSDYSACTPTARTALALRPADEARRYTGVQDYSDYTTQPDYYDPNRPLGSLFGSWPRYQGLMDRGQRPFQAAGLSVPSYVARGNHDGLVQGNAAANAAFEQVATGCDKPYAIASQAGLGGLDPGALLRTTAGTMFVPPDPARRYLSKRELKTVYSEGSQRDDHGFAYVDPAQNAASNGAASYYSWHPVRGVRFISLDSVAEGGVAPTPEERLRTDEGNIDDPQYRWLEGQLKDATRRDELVVAFAHHPIRSLVSEISDESAPSCTSNAAHDTNPGCDRDPRSSSPVHGGVDRGGVPGLKTLFDRYPHFVSYVAGHTHENEIRPCGTLPAEGGCGSSPGWWEVNTSAVADWPTQHRLVDLMDNRDGTLSLFATILDSASPASVPGPSASAAAVGAFDTSQLASLNRVMAFNDPQTSQTASGGPEDRNTELIVHDPRRSTARLLRRCAAPDGRLTTRSVGRARLGAKRRTNRRRFPTFRRLRRTVDRFCLVRARPISAGYPSARLLRRLPSGLRRRVRGRAVLLLTAGRIYSAKRVRAGTRVRTLKRRVRGLRRFRVGKYTWYVAKRGRRSGRLVFRTRRGKVRTLGVANRRLTATQRGTRRFLRAFR